MIRFATLLLIFLLPYQACAIELLEFPGYWVRGGMSDDGTDFLQMGQGEISIEFATAEDLTEDGELRGRIGFLSNRNGQSVQLQPLPGHNRILSGAYLSRSGEFATGWSVEEGPSARSTLPVLWNADGVSHALPLPIQAHSGRGFAVADDGNDAVGLLRFNCTERPCENRPYLWSHGDGEYTEYALPILPGFEEGSANSVTRNGEQIVGTSFTQDSNSIIKSEATLWTNDELGSLTPISLGQFNGKDTSGLDISDDGSAVIGVAGGQFVGVSATRSASIADGEPFRWTKSGGFVSFGNLQGTSDSKPLAINADASIVIGSTDDRTRAFVWDVVHGMRDLKSVLISEHGLSENSFPQNLETLFVNALSGDATALGGVYWDSTNTLSTGFSLYLDRPLVVTSGVVGDFNGNAKLDVGDVDLLANEITSDRVVDLFDVNDDGMVDTVDREFWVGDLAQTFFGDANLDQKVNFSDFLALSSGFGEPGGWAQGDFDGNGSVAFEDFLMLSENFGQTSVAAQAAVPEPSALGLLVVGLLAILKSNRIRRAA